jgi:serine kinase of HPr protein (carbohydrate metabolism regulator)
MIAHATCLAYAGAGMLLRGPAGSGKSNLALRLMQRGAELVADDRTALSVDGEALIGRAPAAIRGLLEIRGVGMVRVPFQEQTPIDLVVDLLPAPDLERIPEPGSCALLGRAVRRIALHAFETAALEKLGLAAAIARQPARWLT